MKIKRRKKAVFAETAASSDLAFLLIIYFLVIAGFNVNLGFLVNLPERGSIRIVEADELLRFEMDNNGKLFYEAYEINIAGAERIIRTAVARHPNLALLLLIDGGAPWQQVVSFVELAQMLQVDSFSFNKKPKGEL